MKNALVKMFAKSLITIVFLISVLTTDLVAAPKASNHSTITIASYNLRFNNPNDGVNAWPLRKNIVMGLIRFHQFDIFGTQEGLADQINDLTHMTEYAYVGVGRDDGKHAGEHSAIFYRKSRFELLQNGDFWLSETPEKPSKGWDATCCNRLASWAQLRDKQTNKTFYVFSVHFDHEGAIARTESAKLMLRKIQQIAHNQPVICVGDFNSTPESEQINTMLTILGDAHQVSSIPAYGPEATFNNFDWNTIPEKRIDYIFVNNKIKVTSFGTLSDSQEQRYPSDHFPVMARINID